MTNLTTAASTIAAVIALATAAVAAPSVRAQAMMDHGKMMGNMPMAHAAGDMTDAEVRKVDRDAGKVTLKHAEIKSLDMPSMTMVFGVKDKAMLDKLQPGDKIKFKAINDGGKFTVTEFEVVR